MPHRRAPWVCCHPAFLVVLCFWGVFMAGSADLSSCAVQSITRVSRQSGGAGLPVAAVVLPEACPEDTLGPGDRSALPVRTMTHACNAHQPGQRIALVSLEQYSEACTSIFGKATINPRLLCR